MIHDDAVRLRVSAEQERFRLEARAFVSDHVTHRAGTIDRAEQMPPELVAEVKAAGYLATRVPNAYGGQALDAVSYGLLHQEFGRGCGSTRALLTVHDMVAEAITRLGSTSAKKHWLPRLVTGQTIAAFALTEPQAGSDAASITTTAVENADGYVLDGRKKWISFGQVADLILVLARVGEEGSIAGFLVPRDAGGLTVSPLRGLLGLRGSMLAELTLESCHVPADARVGSARMPNGLVAATALGIGRFGVAWGCVGMASACFDDSVRYANEREQFGSPLGEHQLIRQMLTDMAAGVRTAFLVCLDAALATQNREPDAGAATLMAKYVASRAAADVTATAVQLHGALGCSDELPIERHFRDARVMEVIEGSTQIQQLLIGGHVLKAARSSGDNDALAGT